MRDTRGFLEGLACPEAVKQVLLRALDWDAEIRPANARALCAALTPSEPDRALGVVHTALVDFAPMRFIRLTGGEFVMGSPADEPGRRANEAQHQVRISEFEVAEAPVTQAQWREVMGDENPSYDFGFQPADDHPAENVSWFRAIEFCNELSKREGRKACYVKQGEQVIWDRESDGYRLLTEAEWEYACRAGSKHAYCFGVNVKLLGRYATYNQRWGGTSPVKSLLSNTWGLYDMHGNVWEWVWDEYGGPYNLSPSPEYRTLRGGSCGDDATLIRCAVRCGYRPESYNPSIGLRLACSVSRVKRTLAVEGITNVTEQIVQMADAKKNVPSRAWQISSRSSNWSETTDFNQGSATEPASPRTSEAEVNPKYVVYQTSGLVSANSLPLAPNLQRTLASPARTILVSPYSAPDHLLSPDGLRDKVVSCSVGGKRAEPFPLGGIPEKESRAQNGVFWKATVPREFQFALGLDGSFLSEDRIVESRKATGRAKRVGDVGIFTTLELVAGAVFFARCLSAAFEKAPRFWMRLRLHECQNKVLIYDPFDGDTDTSVWPTSKTPPSINSLEIDSSFDAEITDAEVAALLDEIAVKVAFLFHADDAVRHLRLGELIVGELMGG